MDKQGTPSLPDRPRPRVSVVIPVYRAEKTLPDLYGQLSAAMAQVASVFEIIFVEDGGGDGSWPIDQQHGEYTKCMSDPHNYK
jgi:hypothetical protein